MFSRLKFGFLLSGVCATLRATGGPVIDPIANVSIPAGKSLTIPITATSTNGRPLTYTVTSSTNRITVELHTNNPFWKLSVVQVAASNAPGAYLTPFRGGLAMVTNVGEMTLLLLRDRAPRTVDVFQGLTMAGYFSSNTIFHRVVNNLNNLAVVQAGDPQTNGAGGPIFRYDDEFHPRSIFSGNGQLAMANSGKDTDGSQFFLTQGPQRFLDFGYSLFGQLIRGFNVLTNIITTPTNNTASRPLRDVIITRASFVTNYTDTAITLTGTNLAGVAGTIRVIADDGVGGRVTNTFTAATVSDAANDDPPFLSVPAITNLIVPVNGRLTNWIASTDLENNTKFYDAYYSDLIPPSYAYSPSKSNSWFAQFPTNSPQFILMPSNNYSGPLKIYVAVAPNASFTTYDYQEFTVAVGDTPIWVMPTSFVAQAGVTFSNLVAAFTNGVPNSATTNFVAAINWGDNSTNNGSMTTNLNGWKEVRRAHTYTNSGTYPIYIRVRSNLGAETTVVSMAYVQPTLFWAHSGTNNTLRWPAWASDYLAQIHTNLSTPDWTAITNLPSLVGFENVLTNSATTSNAFFRLRR